MVLMENEIHKNWNSTNYNTFTVFYKIRLINIANFFFIKNKYSLLENSSSDFTHDPGSFII